MACFGQLSGNSVTGYYLPVMVEQAGITSESTQLLINSYMVVPLLVLVVVVEQAHVLNHTLFRYQTIG